MNKNEEITFLPLGSIVSLKKETSKIMIIGFAPMIKNDITKRWDYLGCPYPTGVMTTEQSIVFNKGDIDKIFHKGYVDKKQIEYVDFLSKLATMRVVEVKKN